MVDVRGHPHAHAMPCVWQSSRRSKSWAPEPEHDADRRRCPRLAPAVLVALPVLPDDVPAIGGSAGCAKASSAVELAQPRRDLTKLAKAYVPAWRSVRLAMTWGLKPALDSPFRFCWSFS